MLAADSAAFVGDMYETVTYRPRAATSPTDNSLDRSISAVVNRNPAARPDELTRGVTPSLEISVRNDSTYGISISELQAGGDAIYLKLRLGDSADTRIELVPPDTQDAGMLTFRIGKRK